ncbi:MAG: threonine ammonia-lyase [Acidobacteriota bacterium]
MVSLKDIQEAAAVIKGRVIKTPLIHSPNLSRMTGAEVYLKLENLQETGSFKLRGATHKIHCRLKEIGTQGVVAASAGNHAQGVALAAKRAGFTSTIVMPEQASISKQQATEGYGGRVILKGENIAESIQVALELAEGGMMLIHPYDDPEIISGQGTIGLEILKELPEPDYLYVPIGGGGLMSGIATVFKDLSPRTRVIGVQTSACPSAFESSRKGQVVRVEAARSIADGIAVKQVGEETFRIIREKVDDIVLVDEDRIAEAMLMLLERKKMIAEGAGAVPLAAFLHGPFSPPAGSRVVLVISGGNVDSPLLDRVIRKGLFGRGRIMRVSVWLDDMPGALAALLNLIASIKANVLNIRHYRTGWDLPIYMSRVELELETRGVEHINEVHQTLQSAGYKFTLPRRE